jgi:hypothetical protein
MSVGFRAELQAMMAIERASPIMDQYLPAMDLVRVGYLREPQALPKPLPRFPGFWRWWVGEESEVPNTLTLASASTRCALDDPRELSFPLGVDPVAGIAGSKDFLDSTDMNPGACRAYHGNGLPDIGPIGPKNLSCHRKFHRFQFQPPEGSPGHQ